MLDDALMRIAQLMNPNVQQEVIANVQAQNDQMAQNAARADGEAVKGISYVQKVNGDGTTDISIRNAPKEGFISDDVARNIEEQSNQTADEISSARTAALKKSSDLAARLISMQSDSTSRQLDKADPNTIHDQMSSFGGVYRTGRNLGEGVVRSALDAAKVRTGIYPQDRAEINVQHAQLARGEQMYQQNVVPLVKDERSDMRLENQQNKEDRIATQAEATNHRLILNGALSKIDPNTSLQDNLQMLQDHLGSLQPGDRGAAMAEYGRLQRAQLAKAQASVKPWISNFGKAEVGDFPDAQSFVAAKQGEFRAAGLGRDFTPDEQAAIGKKFTYLKGQIAQADESARLSNQQKQVTIQVGENKLNPAEPDQSMVKFYSDRRAKGGPPPPKAYADAVDHFDQQNNVQSPIALNPKASDALQKTETMRNNTAELHDALAKLKGSPYWNTPFSQLPQNVLYAIGYKSNDPIGELRSQFEIQKWAGTMALLPGMRRGDVIREASKHQPQPNDSPALMYNKLENADDFYVNSERAAWKFGPKSGVPLSDDEATARVRPSIKQQRVQQRRPQGRQGANGQRVITDPDAAMQAIMGNH